MVRLKGLRSLIISYNVKSVVSFGEIRVNQPFLMACFCLFLIRKVANQFDFWFTIGSNCIANCDANPHKYTPGCRLDKFVIISIFRYGNVIAFLCFILERKIMFMSYVDFVNLNFVWCFAAFCECGKQNGLLLPFKCRKENTAQTSCLIHW